MRSPFLYVVGAGIAMQHVEERALRTCRQTISLWLRYVNDEYIAVHKDDLALFVTSFASTTPISS